MMIKLEVLRGYVVAYVYLGVVLLISFGISRIFKNNELSRNIVHIAAGMGWNIYKWFFPATIHPIIISSTFVAITLLTIKKKVAFVERQDGSLGTVYFTLVMLLMSVAGFKNSLLFNLFGISIMCLSLGDALANIIGSRYGSIKIYKEKSLQGAFGCFMACAVVIMGTSRIYGLGIGITETIILSILCTFTELFSGSFDNIAIPSVTYLFGYILMTDGITKGLLISFAVGIAMFFFAKGLQLLNTGASYMLSYFIAALFYYGGIRSYVSLMIVFSIIILIEKVFGKKTNTVTESINKEFGERNEMQLVANCLAAVVMICIYGTTGNAAFLIGFYAAIAETIGDSAASDLGVLSKHEPVDICTLKTIQRGISGGVSLLGTCAGLGVCVISGITYLAIFKGTWIGVADIIIAAFLGIILDSVIGSTIQAQYFCDICGTFTEKTVHCGTETKLVKGWAYIDNSKVNIICNILACVFASGSYFLLTR